jgi:hypothetical protein
LLSSGQTLLFVIAVAGFILLVPAAVWLATGSRVQARRALRGYGFIMVGLLAFGLVGAIVGAVGALMF